MDKKMVCGILLVAVGTVFSAVSLLFAALNPIKSRGMYGVMGALFGTDMFVPLMISLLIMLSGLALCFWLAFKNEK